MSELSVPRCLNPDCRTPLPGKPMLMNSLQLREVKEPEAGDVAICAKCGRIMVFLGYGYTVRDPSEEEARIYGSNKEVMEIRQALIRREGM